MDGILSLAVVAVLCAFVVRWAATRLRLPVPGRVAVITVFVLVVLALWGQTLN
jgi:predicted PurR-regulated permease PerM